MQPDNKNHHIIVKIKNIYHCIFNLFFRGNKNLFSLFLKEIGLSSNKHLYIGNHSALRNCSFIIEGDNNYITIGRNCCLQGVRFYMNSNNNSIIISDGVKINASKLQPTYLNACGGRKIIIGKNSLLSNSIEIHTSDYHVVKTLGGVNAPKDVVIGNNCWIGLQCILLKGCYIADNCVVGARSLLTKKYEDENSLIGGPPAKVIKQNIIWQK